MRRHRLLVIGIGWGVGMKAAPITDPTLRDFAAEIGPTEPVTVRGGATKWAVGGDPDPAAREVRAPEGIVDLRPEEMTVHVRAATRVTDLHRALAEVGQRTSLPEEPDATIGGTLAVGRSSIAVLGRGRARDAALRIRYVAADGALVTAGGSTVKNVSGFDLCRLLVGSLGTIGLMGDAVLRTLPIPEEEHWFRLDGSDPVGVVRSAPTAASVLWDGSTTWVLLAGYEVDVVADRDTLSGLDPQPVDGPPPLPPYRWSRRPSELADLDRSIGFVAEVGVGIVHAAAPDVGPELAPGVAKLHDEVRRRFDPTGRMNPGRRPERG